MYGIQYVDVAANLVNEIVGDSELERYVRWEYARADRPTAILSARGGMLFRSRPRARQRGALTRLVGWIRSRPEKAMRAIDGEAVSA